MKDTQRKDEKRRLREDILAKRALLTAEDIKEKSRKITDKLLDLKEFKAGKVVMSYVDFNNEVETKDFIRTCLQQGKRVAVPVVVRKPESPRSEIIASEIFDPDGDLVPGTYGILEPRKDRLREINPCEIDFAAIPGTVFDVRRNRIGYGAGYYDRFLIKLKKDCLKAGLAFELQIVEELPVEKHDVPLDMIITESRNI